MQQAEDRVLAGRRLGQLISVRLSDIRISPQRPRLKFDEKQLSALTQSIRENGLITPLTLRRAGDGKWELIAGERRVRALKRLNIARADAYVISADDVQSRVMTLIENIQRESLHYLEEAAACRALLADTGMKQEELAKKLGRSPSAMANRLRLTRLSPRVRATLLSSPLTERHARALLSLKTEEDQLRAIEEAVKRGLSVRQLEDMIARAAEKPKDPPKADPAIRLFIRDKRLFVNTVFGAVKQLNRLGLPATGRVEEKGETVEIVITLPAMCRTSVIQNNAHLR